MRYEAKRIGANGAWCIFDTKRGVSILKSVSPMATYNEKVAKGVTALMNTNAKEQES